MAEFIFGGNTGETAESIARKRALAQSLMQQGSAPARNLGEGIGSAASQIAGALVGRKADQQDAAYSDERRQTVARALAQMQGTADWKNPDNPDEVLQKGLAPDRMGGIATLAGSNDPRIAELAMTLQMQDAQKAGENSEWERRFGMQNEVENERMMQQFNQAKELARMKPAATRAPVAIMTPEGPRYVSPDQALGQQPYNTRVGGGSLPVTMQKAEDADLEAVDLARNISDDLSAQAKALESGAFGVGPVDKAGYAVASALGLGGDETSAYNSYRATLEKMRNDSLRLNKGVQTEGDAQRAWNELFSAVGSNDTGTVKKRLLEIDEINARAAKEAQRRIDIRRKRNGTDAFDWEAYQPLGSPLGGGRDEDDDLINKYLGGQ